MTDNKGILEVTGLKTYDYSEDGTARTVGGVGFEVYSGDVLSLVGDQLTDGNI